MQYRKLGKTELDVSVICLGTMTWGQQNTQAEAFAQMDYALERGINFWDTAEMYPVPPSAATQGRTEEMIGNWFAAGGRRDQVVLATKVTGRGDRNTGLEHIRGGPRLTREHIFQAVDASLARLQTDYIDLYQVHWPERVANYFGKLGYRHFDDDGVGIRETLEALAELVRQGKVRHIGVSNETPWGVMQYLRLAETGDLPAIASIQNPYNLLNRAFEVGLAEMAIREQVGLLAYSPLAFGVLSGKYLNGARPEGARLSLFDRFTRYLGEQTEQATRAYIELAASHGLDPVQMALAFVNSRQFTTANIIGATSMEQLRTDIDSINLSLSKEVLDGINEVHRRYSNPAP